MKLVDILARELQVWPENVELMQKDMGGIFEVMPSGALGRKVASMELSGGRGRSRVTRAQWQAAVDALNDIPKFPSDDVEWAGEGLPPVGAVCEMSIGNPLEGRWITGTIACHINWERPVAVAHDCEDVFHGYAEDFRPIRTPEQIATRERSKACDKMYGVILSLPEDRQNNRSDICEALYDAGYRKFEIVDN